MLFVCYVFLFFLGYIKIISIIIVLCGGVSKICRIWFLMKVWYFDYICVISYFFI